MHLFSLTIPIKKKNNRNKSQKSFWPKTSACRDATLKNPPNNMGTTPQHFYTIPTSCQHHRTLNMYIAYLHPLNRQTRLLTPQPSAYKVSAMFSSNNITYTPTLPYRLSTACALFCIRDRPYLPCSIAIALQNTTHPPCTSTCTTHPCSTIPSQLSSTTLLWTQLTNTKHSWQNGTRCRAGVKVLCCHSHLVCLVFLRVPSLMRLFLFRKLFGDFYNSSS